MVGWVILNSDFVLTREKTSRLILNCKQEATAPTDGPGGFMKSFLCELNWHDVYLRHALKPDSAAQTDKARTLFRMHASDRNISWSQWIFHIFVSQLTQPTLIHIKLASCPILRQVLSEVWGVRWSDFNYRAAHTKIKESNQRRNLT